MKPPPETSDFENVPMRRSTRSSTPNSSDAPAPRAPSTPAPCASSTISRAPRAAHSSTISGRGAGHRHADAGPRAAEPLHGKDAAADRELAAAAVVGRPDEILLELVEP